MLPSTIVWLLDTKGTGVGLIDCRKYFMTNFNNIMVLAWKSEPVAAWLPVRPTSHIRTRMHANMHHLYCSYDGVKISCARYLLEVSYRKQ